MSGLADGLPATARSVIQVANVVFLLYFLLINTSYLVLIALAVGEFASHRRSARFAGYEDCRSAAR